MATSIAVKRLIGAEEIISYNGNWYDVDQIKSFVGLSADEELPLKGIHTDMREICWSNDIYGSSLTNTFLMHYTDGVLLEYKDTQESDNLRDCLMTYLCGMRGRKEIL